MTSPRDMLTQFKSEPWDLWKLAKENAQFTIIEDLPVTKNFREWSKKIKINNIEKEIDMYLININVGIIDKDLALGKTEVLQLIRAIPEEITNYKGCVFGISNGMPSFIRQVSANNLDAEREPSRSNLAPDFNKDFRHAKEGVNDNSSEKVPAQKDQRDLLVGQLIQAFKYTQIVGTPLTVKVAFQIAENIMPGKAMDLIMYAKTKGAIVDAGDVYKVVEN